MPILTDFHLHSSHSGDSHTEMGEMIQTAIDKNLSSICFTEHMDMDFPVNSDTPAGMFVLNTDAYLFDILKYREKYKGKIELLFGVELGLQPHLTDEIETYASAYDFDFIIGSSHLCHGIDPYYPAFFEGRPQSVAYREYFDSILENIEVHDDFDVYGHLDYVVRYGPARNANYTYHEYQDIFDQILKALIHSGKGIELNTSGYKYGLHAPHPMLEIIHRYYELGGRILTVGSDGHNTLHIADAFDQAAKDLKACGFSEYTIFKKRIPTFVKL